MFQVYFLSVLCNISVGLFLVFEGKITDSVYLGPKKKIAMLILGFATFIIGIVKLFVVCQPDVIFLGDLLPAIAGILGGMCLLMNFSVEYGKNQIRFNPVLQTIFIDWKKLVGIFAFIVGVLHFILPQVRVF